MLPTSQLKRLLDYVYTTVSEDDVQCFTSQCYFTYHKLLALCLKSSPFDAHCG